MDIYIEVKKAAKIKYNNGKNTVTFLGGLLFGTAEEKMCTAYKIFFQLFFNVVDFFYYFIFHILYKHTFLLRFSRRYTDHSL